MKQFEFKFVRKVLIEKYSKKSMLKFAIKQKHFCLVKLDYEKAAFWRDVENNIAERYPPSNSIEKIEVKFFEMFEVLE